MDLLQIFQINPKHVTILALAIETEKEVINGMFVKAAKVSDLQCGGFYLKLKTR